MDRQDRVFRALAVAAAATMLLLGVSMALLVLVAAYKILTK